MFLPRLVNVFEGLEGEDGGGDFAGLAVPDEFDLALIVKEEEAVALGQRLALLDELDEVALLGVGQLVAFGVGRSGLAKGGLESIGRQLSGAVEDVGCQRP